MKPWFKIWSKTGKTAEILIHEDIGENWWDGSGVTSKGFIEAVRALGELDDITVRINSRGGSLYDGVAIYNYLRTHSANVTVVVDGIAASAASVVAMAGDEIVMPAASTLMIHDPITFAFGNAAEMRKAAEDLDKVKEGFISAYTNKTGMPREDVWDLMTAETYMTAAEAVEWGFADRVDEETKVAACDRSALSALLVTKAEEIRAALQTAEPDPDIPAEVRALAASFGVEASAVANALASTSYTLAPPPPPLPEAAMVAEACEEAGFAWAAVDCIKARLSLEQIQARLGRISAARDVAAAAQIEPTEQLLRAWAAADPAEITRHVVDCTTPEGFDARSQLAAHQAAGGETSGPVYDKIYGQRRRSAERH